MNEKNTRLKPALLLLFAIMFVVLQATGIVLKSLWAEFCDISWIAVSVLDAALCFVMFFSYKSHAKNIMKPALGASLGLFLYYTVDDAFYYIQHLNNVIDGPGQIQGAILFAVLSIGAFVSVLVMNIVHYVLNASHRSNSVCVKLNKISFIIYIICILGTALTTLFYYEDIMYSLSLALVTVSDFFNLAIIISIESALDFFKKERELEADPDETEITLPKKSKASTLFIVVILYGIFMFGGYICSSIVTGQDYSRLATCIISFTFALGICFAYRFHTKNVMKPFIGATFYIVLFYCVELAATYIQFFQEMLDYYDGNGMAMYMVFRIAICAMMLANAVLFVLINATHKSCPGKVKAFKYITAATIVLAVLQSITNIFIEQEDILQMINYMCTPIAHALVMCLITVVVSLLEKHREAREAAAPVDAINTAEDNN